MAKKPPQRTTQHRKKKQPVSRRPRQRRKRGLAPKEQRPKGKWLTVTFAKGAIPDVFFPSNIFPEYVGRRITFQKANEKPIDFWKDKRIIFHMADRSLREYKRYYQKIITNAEIAYIKFACGTGATDMTHYDMNPDRPIFAHYRMMSDLAPNFLWEMPMNYNMFYEHVNKVPLTLYDKHYEKRLKPKEIDFLFVMDDRIYYNYVKTLKIGEELKKDGYNVVGILINSPLAKMYHKKLNFTTIMNNKTPSGQQKFHDLLSKSKIMVDLAFRWTYGRNIYEALFNGAICIGTSTYGAMYHLFPDLIIDAPNYNMKQAKNFCIETLNRWSQQLVKEYRNRAKDIASPEKFAERLNSATQKILNGEKYVCEDFQ